MFVPGNYERLVSSLELPNRLLPLTRFERMAPGEGNAIGRMVRRAATIVVETYCAAKQADGSAFAMRDQHAKPHGCLRATFAVRGDIPPELARGVFQPNKRYDAVVRLSNAQSFPQSDRVPDGRGMAIKLFGVPGRNILAPEQAAGDTTEQDFLLTNFPVFFARGVDDYTKFLELLVLPRNTRIEKLKQKIRFGLFFLRRPPRQFFIFWGNAIGYPRSPLHASYHSMTPYLLGDDQVVRYRASPARIPHAAPRRPWRLCDKNFLRDGLAAELRPGPPESDQVVIDFFVQLRNDPTPDDVEDPSRAWRRPQDRLVKVAQIEIPQQNFDTPQEWHFGENLSFSPWHCLREHRPLGGLNRMRLAVYRASRETRRQLNMVR